MNDTANHDQRYSLGLETGFSVTLSSFGASIVEIKVPNGSNQVDDVVLGFDKREEYDTTGNPYFGSTVGRVANRIKNA